MGFNSGFKGLITGITLRNDVYKMQQDQTPYSELHRVVFLVQSGRSLLKSKK